MAHQKKSQSKKQPSFGIIGYGKMGSSLVKGAIKSGVLSAPLVKAYDMDCAKLELARKDGLSTAGNLADVACSDVILLAVKPKDVPGLLDMLKELVPSGNSLILSIAAGVRLSTIEEKLGEGTRLIRVMPNIAASVNEAASVYVPNKWAKDSDVDFVGGLLGRIGKAFKLPDESMIDAVTGISGSGPAYFFYMMKALETVGKRVGLPEDLVRILVAQTCRGAGTLVLESEFTQDHLMAMVASPGGTTEEALKVMESKDLSSIMIDAVVAAIEKAKKMSRS